MIHHWGVILAGGDGTRLNSLTQRVSHDGRPKQFCRLWGGKTLFAQTRLRIASGIEAGRTLYVLTQAHERFYRTELEGVPAVQLVVQPSNKGTLPAILWSLLRLTKLDKHAAVAFFPSDHFYSDDGKFMDGIESALKLADANSHSVILMAAMANRPEDEYGWIEPDGSIVKQCRFQVMRVKRFWEKPSYQTAQRLLDRSCLWNTFVMVGRAGAFLEMIEKPVPETYRIFEQALTRATPATEGRIMQHVYNALPVADFSRQVLAISTERLAVASLGDIGWSDLGDPRRLITTLFERGIENPWVTSGSCSHCGLVLSPS